MLQKEVFFHEQTPFSSHSLGFSAVFVPAIYHSDGSPEVNKKGDLMVWMGITHCNKKDKHFNKKIARAVLRQRAMELVRCKDVPGLLAAARVKAYKFDSTDCVNIARHYNYILRAFL